MLNKSIATRYYFNYLLNKSIIIYLLVHCQFQSLFTKIGQVLTVNIEHTRSHKLENNSFIYIYDGEVSSSDRYFNKNYLLLVLNIKFKNIFLDF